jgi:hypothetical protein
MRAVISCLVLAVCAWTLSPRVRAEQAPVRFAGQWRIFPRAPFSRPADAEVTARLTRQIDATVALFEREGIESDVPPERLADLLIDGKVRTQLFRLESLLRLYARAVPDFEKYLAGVKEVEDGLGAYSLVLDSVSFAEDKFKKESRTDSADARQRVEQRKVLDSLEKKRVAARFELAKLVEQSPLVSDLAELQSRLSSDLAGWGPSRDLAYVNGELQRGLKNVRDGHFNFNLLEDGIHEFRRRLRWFPMLIDSLDGLILLRDDPPGACPVPSLEALAGSRAARHRYSNPALSFPASHPCTISRCLLWQVVKTTDELGRLKDVAEGNLAIDTALDDDDYDVASSNKVSREEIARATAIRAELFSSRALDVLIGQLASCKP